jgi:signal transduction histidine kinase/ligand-binding sensor domain-containing protein/DNA-binding NarL/FixJ family response regulator
MNVYCRYIIFAILLFFSRHARPNTGAAISHLGIQQGLSNNSVQCIYQDHNGLMWFGTYDGLNSYDGYGFRVFRNTINDTGSIPHNYIYTIHEDKFNNLWVGTGQGVAVYNRIFDRFSPVYFHPVYALTQKDRISCSINTIKSDATGNVYIGTNGWGLFLKKQGNDAAKQIPVHRANKETNWYNVQAIYVDKPGRVWLFIETVGLCLFDPRTNKISVVNNSLRSVISLEVDDAGSIWMGTENGLFQYDIASNSFFKHYIEKKGQLTMNMVISLCSDAHNNLWIGTLGGVNMLNKITGAFQYLLPGESKDQLSSESVHSIFVDKESRVWMGTLKGGIDILDVHKSRFQTITHNPFDANSLINNFVSSFYADKNGDLWIGTDGGGFSIWNRQKNQFTNFRHQVNDPRSLSNNSISCIKQDYLGNTWLASFGGGINKFNRATGSFEHYKCMNETTGQENKNVWLLYEDREQNFWATTFGNGKLYRLNRQQNRFEMFDTELNDLISIAEDHNGVLWAGNARQLIRLDRQNKKHVFYETGKPVRAIFEDSHHNLWVGTEGGGLILFDRKTGHAAVRYSTEEGLTNNAVLNILEDAAGHLWISTFNGLSKFDPVKKTFQNFYQSDGLQSNQFSYNAALRLQSGELAFGGINGFNLFFPQQVNTRTFMPALLFSSIWVNNKPLAAMPRCIVRAGNDRITELRIPYNEAILSFHFTALEYSSPEKVNYAYFLEGWDKDWNYPGNVRTINYNNISEGSYWLRVKSTNAEGIWNTKEATIKIIILPPWYRSWWAWLLYISIASALIYVYYRYKARQSKLEYEIKLAHLDAEKEKEINDKRHSFFTNISHEFRTPLTLIINPIKDILRGAGDSGPTGHEKDLTVVYRNARRLLSLVDQLLIFRKADVAADKMTFAKHNFYNLCNEVYLCFVQQARSNHLSYIFECDNPNLELYVDREKMEIVLYNLLSNAIKFTPPGGTITFKVQALNDTVQLLVQDTGYGIPEAAKTRLFEKFYQATGGKAPLKPGFGIGLYLVRHFITAHKGTVILESEEGKGTTFCINLQKGKAHLVHETILEEAQKETVILDELLEEPEEETPAIDHKESNPGILVTDRHSVLIADDDHAIRHYLHQMLKDKYHVIEAVNGQEALTMVQSKLPDLVISDIRMDGMDGIELCKKIKKDAAMNHIPVILLTASKGSETELQSIEEGADLYITKPFDKDLLLAKVENIFKTRNELRNYFFNEITLKQSSLKVSAEYKEFLENCIAIVERHLNDDHFTIKVLVKEIGMSHSNLYKKIRLLSGQSITNFIRYIRLRKAAELMLKSACNVNQAAFEVGISDIKYFRTQFNKLFGMNPSEYIKKYRHSFNSQYNVNGRRET